MANRLVELNRSDATIHGVLAEGSDSLARSLKYSSLQPLVEAASNANRRFEGSCVNAVSARTVELCLKYPNLQLNTIGTDEVEALIADYDQHRRDNWLGPIEPYEPTTLVAVAGLSKVRGSNPVVLGTGRNAPLYPAVARRSQLRAWNGH